MKSKLLSTLLPIALMEHEVGPHRRIKLIADDETIKPWKHPDLYVPKIRNTRPSRRSYGAAKDKQINRRRKRNRIAKQSRKLNRSTHRK